MDYLETIPAPYNPRGEMPEHEMESLRRALDGLGVLQPITVNVRSAEKGWPAGSAPVIVGGHQRVKAARALGMGSFPVFWVDLDRKAEKAANIALNRISGVWDISLRDAVVKELAAEGFDLGMTGLDSAELGKTLGWNVQITLPPENIGGSDGSWRQITFVVSDENSKIVAEAIDKAKHLVAEKGGAESNRNGLALVAIAKAYLRV